MLKYKIDVADALERRGFGAYQARKSGLLSQDTLKKVCSESTSITLDSLNGLCAILDLQPKDILEYVEGEEEREGLKNFVPRKNKKV